MPEITPVNFEGVEQMPLEQFTRKAYLDYSMYVIMDRALPFLGDGLKPVQRRIVYAMSELGLKATAKYKKSARTVGDVLGKYHPHGDVACYEAMVLMAQPFSYRYPLVDGQGNWGAADDPKSFAAMRYTEARLAPYTEILLSELGMGTVDWGPNFDGTLQEPRYMPARLPNVLLNGTTGIAVGMATDIPPHNLREVVAACLQLLDAPETPVEDLCAHIQGPDYPTGSEIITPRHEIVEMYRTGRGMIRMRATFERENGNIVVTSLPYQVSPAKVIEQIAAQMTQKKLPMVSDLRDESDHEEPIRMVIVPRSNRIDTESLMAHLFATTDLERTYRVNINMIGLDRKPCVKGLGELLGEWLTFRRQTVRRRLQFRLDRVLERLHILDGLLIAYLNLDEVIRIIRSQDDPKAALVKRFRLTETQAEAILQLRLRYLAKLEEMKIRDERQTLDHERQQLEQILASERRLTSLIKKELRQDAAAYGDERRSRLVQRKEAQAISQVELAPVEPVTVILSVNGWVRAAKGHDIDPESLGYKVGDALLGAVRGRSNQSAVFLDSTGRTYAALIHSLPSARGQGEPLTGRFSLPPGAVFKALLTGEPRQPILLASDAGYGFVTELGHLLTKNQKGKALLTLPKGAQPLPPICLDNPKRDLLVVVTNEGRMLIFPVRRLPVLPKGKGNKIIQIAPKRARERVELVTLLTVIPEGTDVVVHAGKRFLRLPVGSINDYVGERGRRGKKLPRGFRNVTAVQYELSSQRNLF